MAYIPYTQPQNLDEFVGQAKAKRMVAIMVGAALKTQQPLPNTLITGPFGQGKTALATLMANSFRSNIRLIDASTVNRELPPDGTYIIDEIHNLNPEISDQLNVALDRNKYHIIGVTLSPGKIPAAFRSRFRQINLEPYSQRDIEQIIRNALRRRNTPAASSVVADLARRSRFNPRTALNYLSFALDVVTVKNATSLTSSIAKEAFKELGVDQYGLTFRDYEYLKAIPTDRPVGLQYIGAKAGLDESTIEEEIEPYLLQLGLVDRTSRGRIRIDVK